MHSFVDQCSLGEAGGDWLNLGASHLALSFANSPLLYLYRVSQATYYPYLAAPLGITHYLSEQTVLVPAERDTAVVDVGTMQEANNFQNTPRNSDPA